MTAFGDWVFYKRVTERKLLGLPKLTQQELVELGNGSFSFSYISAIERGAGRTSGGEPHTVTKNKVDAIATALGADINEARQAAGLPPRGSETYPSQQPQVRIMSNKGTVERIEEVSVYTASSIARLEKKIDELLARAATGTKLKMVE